MTAAEYCDAMAAWWRAYCAAHRGDALTDGQPTAWTRAAGRLRGGK